jgi:hypothetical protein
VDPTPEVQFPVVALEVCAPPGALGLTKELVQVRCVVVDGDVARWEFVDR